MRIIGSFIFLLFILAGCGENAEVLRLREENSRYRDSLNVLHTAPELLATGEKFLAAKDFSQARQKFQQLVDQYGDQPESAQAKLHLLSLGDEEAWYAAETGTDTANTVAYMAAFHTGRHAGAAKALLIKQRVAAKETAYSAAVSANTSRGWKDFLSAYPTHPDAEAIREKMIRLEVDEILAGEHGDMPATRSVGASNSTGISAVSIENNTGYPLTVFYSGPVARSVEIPVSGSRTTSLPSGSYQVAATANGLHYGGTENLTGDYSSEFYIRSTTSFSRY